MEAVLGYELLCSKAVCCLELPPISTGICHNSCTQYNSSVYTQIYIERESITYINIDNLVIYLILNNKENVKQSENCIFQ
jgi:hypothetical protein